MKTFKGFNRELKCRDFQYEIGKEYEESTAECCNTGFHACEFPLDCFNCYNPADSRYCEVEQSGEMSRDNSDSKIASTKIKIGAEIGLNGLIKAGVKFILERVDFKNNKETNTGDYSAYQTGENDYEQFHIKKKSSPQSRSFTSELFKKL